MGVALGMVEVLGFPAAVEVAGLNGESSPCYFSSL
jgi:hypothetical protein